MIPQTRTGAYRKTTVCVDSYHNGVPQGRIFPPEAEPESFESLTHFLLRMEELLDVSQTSQSYCVLRSFGEGPLPLPLRPIRLRIPRGRRATFEVQVLFRQNTSWQGVLFWKEGGLEKRFRSVLELVMLMDSALRNVEGY